MSVFKPSDFVFKYVLTLYKMKHPIEIRTVVMVKITIDNGLECSPFIWTSFVVEFMMVLPKLKEDFFSKCLFLSSNKWLTYPKSLHDIFTVQFTDLIFWVINWLNKEPIYERKLLMSVLYLNFLKSCCFNSTGSVIFIPNGLTNLLATLYN